MSQAALYGLNEHQDRSARRATPAVPEAKDIEPAPKRGRRAPRMSGDDRERAILDAAQQLLQERPVQDISIDDLTRSVGISRPAFYFYFSSKAAVVLALLDRMAEAVLAATHQKFEDAGGDPVKQWRAAIHASIRTWGNHAPVVVAVAQLRAQHPEIRELWTAIMERWVRRVEKAIEADRRCGVAPPGLPARELAIALTLMNERSMLACTIGEDPALPEDRLVDILTQIWVNAIYLDPAPRQLGEASRKEPRDATT
ncbi:TetR/AcrR family transcriptional regulator [Kribbella sp. NPDC051587]|uniref:TetR/AcrR family transcriptional regulator n=1 Tax=Kribbella sp. NPDC051587 TaxID=3364119 RepID=UPI003799EB58